MTQPSDLLHGTLDLMILRTLALGPLHGLGVSDRIEQVTRGVFRVRPGSLFPALHRLEQRGWIDGDWRESENKRRAKYYALTKAGRQRLIAEKQNWKKIVGAMTNVLEAT